MNEKIRWEKNERSRKKGDFSELEQRFFEGHSGPPAEFFNRQQKIFRQQDHQEGRK